ncbi:acid-sensing ion channel 1-like [Biomphalaria glabrata]|uniref:Acid-sensing ion channel 1-like n=1 Tax=Biomphalaria glabrata TaxID=6526 RepID=A0A9U8ENN5_BIOGL|nr:acid-sensing ion channel 1-like [Biomphalaria glabrata]KAI8727681.1 acid-sensing ion channel 1-like [Biomphalaria glabrata]
MSTSSTSVKRKLSVFQPISVCRQSPNYVQLMEDDQLTQSSHSKSSFKEELFNNLPSFMSEDEISAQHRSQNKEKSTLEPNIFYLSSPRLKKRTESTLRHGGSKFYSFMRSGILSPKKLKVKLFDRKRIQNKSPAERETCRDIVIEKLALKYKRKCQRLLHNFAGETTAHGYKRWISRERSLWLKCAWIVLLLTVLCLLISSLQGIVADNQLNSFTSSFTSQRHDAIAFPAITVCNIFPYNLNSNNSVLVSDIYYKQLRLMEHSGKAATEWNENIDDSFLLSNLSLFSWDLNSFLASCAWENVSFKCSDIFVRTISQSMSCFTFNADLTNIRYANRVGSDSGLSLKINLGHFLPGQRTAGVKIILHDSTEFPNTFNRGILVAPNTTAYISLDKKESKYLSLPHKAYGTEYCFDYLQDGGIIRSEFYRRSGYSWCLAECRFKRIIRTCQCSMAGDPDVPGIPLCTVKGYFQCYLPMQIIAYKETPSNQSDCYCPLPCYKVEHAGKISTAAIINTSGFVDGIPGSNSLIEITIYYEELLTLMEEHVPKYLLPDLLGAIGGQIGLFTGASILTLLEFLELVYLLVCVLVSFVYNYIQVKWRTQEYVH